MADIDEQAFFQGTSISSNNSGISRPIGSNTQLNPYKKGLLLAKLVLYGLGVPLAILVISGCTSAIDRKKETEFSMQLAGFQGLNNNAMLVGDDTAVVSPTTTSWWFSLKVRAEHPHAVVRPWCYGGSGGEAVVSYSGVALAWGQVPRFCISKGRMAVELTVLPWARGVGVGLSDDLRRRLAEDWSMGAAQVKVETKLFYDDQGSSSSENNGPVLHSFQLMLTHDLLRL